MIAPLDCILETPQYKLYKFDLTLHHIACGSTNVVGAGLLNCWLTNALWEQTCYIQYIYTIRDSFYTSSIAEKYARPYPVICTLYGQFDIKL